MRLAEGMTAGGQGHGLVIVHGHAGKSLANIARRCERVGVAVRAFGVDIDQAHLHGAERVFKLAVAAVALIAQPFVLGAPVNVQFRFPHILAPAAKAKGLAAHGFIGAVASQDQQIGPGYLPAVFLLDRPQQQPRLVQVAVIGPTVERRETLRARARAAASVGDPIGAGAVPGHADKKRAVMPIIGRPPGFRVGHQVIQVLLQCLQVEALEGCRIIEVFRHRVGLGRMLVQDVQPELIRPPVPIAGAAAGREFVRRAREWTLAGGAEVFCCCSHVLIS